MLTFIFREGLTQASHIVAVSDIDAPRACYNGKVPDNDPTFTLTITRATGLFRGTFSHTNDTLLPFKGILLQKGANAGGWGFFLYQAAHADRLYG